MIKINEDLETKFLGLVISDPENQIRQLLNVIKSYSTAGHSFNVVVDPDDKDRRKEFFIDGDGNCKLSDIQNVKLNESVLNEDSAVLEVPDGKSVESLPVSHFKSLIDKKGRDKIWKAITNLQVWFKNKDPKLSKWAIGMKKSLGDYGEKE